MCVCVCVCVCLCKAKIVAGRKCCEENLAIFATFFSATIQFFTI